MAYTFYNKNGLERTYDNLQDFVRALENQRRVERLQELNAGHVPEEVVYDSQKWQEIPREHSTSKPE